MHLSQLATSYMCSRHKLELGGGCSKAINRVADLADHVHWTRDTLLSPRSRDPREAGRQVRTEMRVCVLPVERAFTRDLSRSIRPPVAIASVSPEMNRCG
jgi:hypothetical protein